MLITRNENIRFIKEIEYPSFLKWIEYRIDNDKLYTIKDSFYSIAFIFEKNSVILKSIDTKIQLLIC